MHVFDIISGPEHDDMAAVAHGDTPKTMEFTVEDVRDEKPFSRPITLSVMAAGLEDPSNEVWNVWAEIEMCESWKPLYGWYSTKTCKGELKDNA